MFYGPNHRLDGTQFAALAEALTAAAEDVLAAKRDKIQILPFELAHRPFGRPVGIEIKARAVAGRSDAVVEAFLTRVDDISFAAFGDRCRIRYLRFPVRFWPLAIEDPVDGPRQAAHGGVRSPKIGCGLGAMERSKQLAFAGFMGRCEISDYLV